VGHLRVVSGEGRILQGHHSGESRNPTFLRGKSNVEMDYWRHPWRSPFGPPSAFAFAILQTQSGFRRDEASTTQE